MKTYAESRWFMKTYADLIKLIESKGFSNEEAVSFVKIEKNMKGNAGAADSAECGDDVYKFYESRTMVEIDPTKAW